MLDKIKATCKYIEERIEGFKPEYGIILGTGLGRLIEDIDVHYELHYANIPNFPISTVEFHSGKLIFGILKGKPIVAMQGRLHYYEGYSMQEITFPVRVMKAFGIKRLFISNAGGSLNPEFKKGELMIIEDHINLLPSNPLRGRNVDSFGPRFPDMSVPYDKQMIRQAQEIAGKKNIKTHLGVYVSVPGPSLETRAEYRYLRMMGGDVVGMSTVPEVIVANHMSLPVFAISVITDEGFPENLTPFLLEEIIQVANETEPIMTEVLKELIYSIND